MTSLLDADNEGVGLNIYDPHIVDPYAANGIYAEIATNLSKITENIIGLTEIKGNELIVEDLSMLIEKIIDRNPLPHNLMNNSPAKIYQTLRFKMQGKGEAHEKD